MFIQDPQAKHPMPDVATFREGWRRYLDRMPGSSPQQWAPISEAAFYAGGVTVLALFHRAFKKPEMAETVQDIEAIEREIEEFTALARKVLRKE